MVFRGKNEIRDAYRDPTVAEEYIGRRFLAPLGALLHARQVGVLKKEVRQRTPRRALEIAPGPGRVTTDVLSALPSLTVMDASAQMLAVARRRVMETALPARVAWCQGDAFQLPFGGVFDLVFTFRLIRHFEQADRQKLYRQIGAVLQPGGTLIMDVVNREVSAPLRAAALPDEYRHFDALLTVPELRQELSECGFQVVALHGVQHRFSLLQRLQILLAPRCWWLARMLLEVVDRSTGGEPLEWIAVCRRA